MKKNYTNPEILIVNVCVDDVVRTSSVELPPDWSLNSEIGTF